MSYPTSHARIGIPALLIGLLLSFAATADAASDELFVYDRSAYTHVSSGGQHTIHWRNRVYSVNPAAGSLNRVVKEWGYSSTATIKPEWDSEPNSNPYISTTVYAYPDNPSFGMTGGDGRLWVYDGTGPTLLNGQRLLRAKIFGLETNQGDQVFTADSSANTTLNSWVTSGSIAYVPESESVANSYVYLLTNESTSRIIRVKKDGSSPVALAIGRVNDTIPSNKGYLAPRGGTVRGCMTYGAGHLWIFDNNLQRLTKIVPLTGAAVAQYWLPMSFRDGLTTKVPRGEGLAFDEATQTLYLWDGLTKNGQNYLWPIPLSSLTATNVGTYQPIMQTWTGTRPSGENPLLIVGMTYAGVSTTPVVTLTAPDADGSEGGANGMTLQLTRTGTSGDLDVYFNLSPTTWRDDLTLSNGNASSARIPNGASSVTVAVSVIDDALNEGTESFTAALTPDPRITAYTIGSPSSATLTVTDNDTIPTVTITASDSSGTEGGDAAAFTVAVNPLHPTNLVVLLKAPLGSATSGSDYTALPTSVTIPANTPSVVVPVSPINDTAYESVETVQVALEANAAYLIGTPGSATVSINDNDKPTVTITASDASATEGGDSATFTISRGNAINTSLTVKFSPPTGSAVSASDYTALPTSVTIPANATTVTMTLAPVDDNIAELPETVTVALLSDPAYTIGSPASATVTIYDNETPVISIAASDANGKEGGTDNGRFTLTRLGLRSAALPVNLDRTGSATAGSDYTAIAASVTIPANSNTLDVTLSVLEDTTTETDETVIVTVLTGTGYTIGTPSSATVTIADNETPRLTIAATDASAAEQGLSTGTFTITRVGNKATVLTVNLGFLTSTATNGTDFDTIAGTLSMAANVTAATITVRPKDDTVMEPSETVVCTIASGTGYVLGTPVAATVTIADNDTQTVTIQATSANAAEPATNGAFVVSRVGPTTADLVVTYSIATGTGRAVNGTDYNTIPLTVTIPAGSTTSPAIPITVKDDTSYEGPETVQLTISSSSTYVVGSPATATVTIADNDKPTVTASLVDGNAAEPSDTGVFRLTRNGILSLGTLTVKYQMSGPAVNGTDYTLLSGTATIALNSATVDVTLTPLPDEIIEGIETAILSIQPDTANYNVGSPSVATVSIGSSVIDTIAGQGPLAYTPTPIMGGQATATGLGTPTGLAVDAAGNRFVVDGDANAVLKITASGVISRFAGNASWTPGFAGDGGQAASASLNNPRGVAVDVAGNVYIADTNNHRVRKVTASTGVITTIAGRGAPRFSGDGGAATSAYLNSPQAVAVDAAGNVYIADLANQRVRKITVSTGVITTVAGNGAAGFAGDGAAATAAQINNPRSVAVDASGNIYVADTSNNRIRKVTVSTGVISTIAGNGTAGFAGDNGAATAAQINAPEGVAVSEFGEVFIADTANNRVRKIEGTTIITVAGNGLEDWTGDGGRATSASLFKPVGLAFDATGNLFVADSWNSSIRRLRAGVSAIARWRPGQAEVLLLASTWARHPEPR